MQWTDWAAIALCLVAAFVDARRGSLVALADWVGVMVAIHAADAIYPSLVTSATPDAAAYLLVLGACLVILFLLTWQISVSFSATYRSPIEGVIGGILGVLTGLTLAHAMFRAVYLAWGPFAPAFADSLLRPEVYNLRTIHALVSYLTGKA